MRPLCPALTKAVGDLRPTPLQATTNQPSMNQRRKKVISRIFAVLIEGISFSGTFSRRQNLYSNSSYIMLLYAMECKMYKKLS